MTPYYITLKELSPKHFGLKAKIWVFSLVILVLIGLYAYVQQLRFGLGETGMRDYAFWGIYISNFVFFVAISLVGSLISAILKLSGAKWSTPLTRISEIIAVASILMAGLIIIVDMGRPERLFNLFIHGRLQSPIIWDVIVISTYLFISLLLLYIPLIPDFAILKDWKGSSPLQRRWYRRLAINWKGNKEQRRLFNISVRTLTILIIPVAFGIHTVTSWLFATTYRPGWDSTNFGPYFIAGAFVAGTGAVIAVMYVVRSAYKLKKYITDKHFDYMGKLLVMLCAIYVYFNINEYLVPAYKSSHAEKEHLFQLFTGHYSAMFWLVIVGGLLLPIVVLLFKKGRKPLPMFIIGLVVVIGAWWKRYIIVTPTLLHPFVPMQGVPESWHTYYASWVEWAIVIGSVAMAALIITLLLRYVPIIPIQETWDENQISIPDKSDSDES